MTEGAISEHRQQIVERITRCAQQLADEQGGLNGFTMDQLAECAGVSRRTLFNYAPGKMDAVLGPDHQPDPELFRQFLEGGPTGDLITDIKAAVMVVLETKQASQLDIQRFHRLLASDPRIHQAAHNRFAKAIDFFAEAIQQREGSDFDPAKAKVAATITLRLFDTALDDYVADPSIPMSDHFSRIFDIAIDLFR